MPGPHTPWAPAPRQGVSASRVGVGAGHWATVAQFLAARFPAVGDWPARLARGDVLDEAGRPLAAETPCRAGAVLWYWRSPPPEPRVPFEIDLLHQDEHLVVVDKPHFLAVIPGGGHLQETVLVRLKRLLGIDSLAPMHRLDRETAGVLAFTVQPGTRNAYQALLRGRQVHKVYEAVAPWHAQLALPCTCRHRLEQGTGTGFMQMQVVAGEPNAETWVELIGVLEPAGPGPGFSAAHPSQPANTTDTADMADMADMAGRADRADTAAQSLPQCLAHYRLTPLTGRKHQLRAQMNALGLPIVGDRIYPRLWPAPTPGAAPDYTLPLQLLARELAFADPISGEPRRFISRRRLQLAGGA